MTRPEAEKSELEKLVELLKSEAIEKQIAAAMLKAKGPGVVEGLGAVLASGVPLLQVHALDALDALARVGAKKALPAIFLLLATSEGDVRRAATRCIASVRDGVVPLIKLPLTGPLTDRRS